VKIVIALLLACTATVVLAHQGEESGAQQMGYDCEHPPADAITALPAAISQMARLSCLPVTQAIVAGGAWRWRYSGTFFEMPYVPAHGHSDSMGLAPPFYFKKITARELDAAQATQRSAELAGDIPTFRPAGAITSMSYVDAVNNYAQIIRMIVAMESDTRGWMLVCAPECRADYVIVLEKLQQH
jgi:hypothetical protein